MPRQKHFDFTVKRLRLCCEILRDHGHRLGLEFIGPRTSRAPHRYGFVYTMDGMLTLCCILAWSGALRPVHGERVELVSWYWHFVDAVWVVVFTVVYVVGR